MDIFLILYCLIFMGLMGYWLLRLPFFDDSRMGFFGDAGICFGLGSGIVYYLILVASFVIPVSSVLLIYLFFFAMMFVSLYIKRPSFPSWHLPKFHLTSLLLLLILSVTVYYVFIFSTWGTLGWDGFAIWGFKAKAFYIDGRITPSFLSESARFGYAHMHYPLQIPANEMWIYQHLGYVNDQKVRLLGYAFYLASLGIFYGGIRKFVSSGIAVLSVVLFSLMGIMIDQSTNGNADLPLAFYCMAGGIFFFRWILDKSLSNLVLAGIFLALSSQVKDQGSYILAIGVFWVFLAILYEIYQKRNIQPLYSFILFVFISSLLFLPWSIIKGVYHLKGWSSGLVEGMEISSILHDSSIWNRVLGYYYRDMCDYRLWGCLWLYLILALLYFIFRWKQKKELIPIWMFFLSLWMVYFAVYVFLLKGNQWFLQTSLTRTQFSVALQGYYLSIVTVFGDTNTGKSLS